LAHFSSAAGCDAHSNKLSDAQLGDDALILTHAPGYKAPARPADLAAWTQHALRQAGRVSRHNQLMFEQHGERGPAPQLPHCGECQVLIQVAEWVAGNSSAMALVETLLDGLCDKYAPGVAACPAVVAELIKFGAKVPALLKHIGLYEPVRLCSFLGQCSVSCCDDDSTPTQIHLAAGSDCTEMHVSWVTGSNNTDSEVAFGIEGIDQQATGYQLTYSEGGWLGTIHRVVLTGLQCGAQYTYAVGGAGAQSSKLTFSTWNDSALKTPFRLAIVGDMGAGESQWATQNIAWLNNQTAQGAIQGVIHSGDVSYADVKLFQRSTYLHRCQPVRERRTPFLTIFGRLADRPPFFAFFLF